MRLALICAAAALATASLGYAAEPALAASNATATKEPKAKKTRKVCRREEPTGSTIPKRVCRTVPVTEDAEAAREPQSRGGSSESAAANR